MLKHIKGFKKCDAKDTFIGKIKQLESGVVNLDNSTGMGTHFTCYYNRPSDEYVYYFDSYGSPPPIQIEKYLKTSNKLIAYNTSIYQPIKSKLCGYYCIYVIEELHKGKQFYDILSMFDMNNQQNNDKMIKKYFSKGGNVDWNGVLQSIGNILPIALSFI